MKSDNDEGEEEQKHHMRYKLFKKTFNNKQKKTWL